MLSNALRLNALSPSNFGSWARICAAFAAAIKAGPGIIALVGPEGSGKTYTLTAFALALDGQGTKLRVPGQPLEPGVWIDLVDGVDAEAWELLCAEPKFSGIQAVAIYPELLAPLLLTHPGARIVRIGSMSAPDIRTMLETRRSQLRLPPDAFTFKALSNLERLCEGNPRKLDRLFGCVERAARAANSNKILGEYVVQANRNLAAAQCGVPTRPVANQPHLAKARVIEAVMEAALRIDTGETDGCHVAPTETPPPSSAIPPPSRTAPERAPNAVLKSSSGRQPADPWAARDPESDGHPDANGAQPTELATAETFLSAHAEMWALLATPSSSAELAIAAKSLRRPTRTGTRLASIGVILAAALILPVSYFVQIGQLAGTAALKAEHYVALTVALVHN